MDPIFVVLLLFSVVLLYFSVRKNPRRSGGRSLPPGPTPLPVVGNLFSIPKGAQPWIAYRELCHKYGGMVFIQVMGSRLLVVSDANIAFDLLEKRSAIYSSRPASKTVTLAGFDWIFAFMPYGQLWRRHRRVFWQYFNPAAIRAYYAAQEEGVHRFLVRLIDDPSKIREHIRFCIVATISKAAYGTELADTDDPMLDVLEKVDNSNDVLLKLSGVLDQLPFLARLPTWLPGTRSIRQLAECRKGAYMLRDLPWSLAKEALEQNQQGTSIAKSMLDALSSTGGGIASEEETIAKSSLALAYGAGVDTQISAMYTFFVVCMLYPHIQTKAQEELDAVIGPNHLPTIVDRNSLPYVNALLKEIIRWHANIPMGLPHQSTTDDVYEGYYIPVDTTVVVNAWAILRDPSIYANPDEFDPKRFLKDGKLDPDVRDPATVAFGFGRRVCPGKHFAEETLFLFIASVLHVFKITPSVDTKGERIPFEPHATSGVVSYLDRWSCEIRPRPFRAATLIGQGVPES